MTTRTPAMTTEMTIAKRCGAHDVMVVATTDNENCQCCGCGGTWCGELCSTFKDLQAEIAAAELGPMQRYLPKCVKCMGCER